MVSSPSPATQVSESDRRRKAQHTLEKAKAGHLTRQLQMRLQYARLKVEHGWQKQNLNEVENLYFHNSHLRSLKPSSSISTQPILMTQPPVAPSASLIPSSATSAPIPNTGPLHNAPPHSAPPQTMLNEQESLDKDLVLALQTVVTAAASSVTAPEAPKNAIHSPYDSMHVDNTATTISPSIRPEVQPSLPQGLQDPISLMTGIPGFSGTSFLLSPQSPTSTTNPSSVNHYPPLKPPRTRNNKHPSGPKGLHQNLTAKEMQEFPSSSNLTYDSFWSSHSVSIPSSMSPRPTSTSGTNAATELQTLTFQNSMLLNNGFPIDLSQFIKLTSPTSAGVTTAIDHSQQIAQ